MPTEAPIEPLAEIVVKQEMMVKEEPGLEDEEQLMPDQLSGVEASETAGREPDVQTLKCALQSSTREFRSINEEQAQRLLETVEKLVHMTSLLSVRGSRLLNGFLISSDQLGVDINVMSDRKRLLDQIFKRFIPDAIGKTGERKPNRELIDWCSRPDVGGVDRFGGQIPLAFVPKCCWFNVTNNIVKRYRTVFENHLVFNYEARLRRYFQTMTRDKKKLDRCIWMVMRIGYDPKPDNPTDEEDWTLTDEMGDAIRRERERFFQDQANDPKKRITEALLKKHYSILLTASKEHLKIVEGFNERNEDPQLTIRTWNLAPMCSIKRHFVPIDRTTLHEILMSIGYFQKKLSFDDFKAIATDTFESIFSSRRKGEPADGMSGKQSRRRRHCHGNSLKLEQNGYIQTDGISVCIQYKQVGTSVKHRGIMKKRKAQAIAVKHEVTASKTSHSKGDESKKSLKRKREDKRRSACSGKRSGEFETETVVYGLDPGRTYIAYVVRLSDGKIFKLSRKQYRADGGIVHAEKTRAKMNRPLQDVLAQLSVNSSKTSKVQTFLRNIDLEREHFERLWDVGYSQKASRLRFHTHCKTQSVLHRFFSQLGGGLGNAAERKQKVFVAYGQAKFSPTGRNEMAVPTTSAFKACAKMWHTHLVDEFRTTKVCHDCGGELVDVKSHHIVTRNTTMELERKRVSNRNLKRCPNACKSTECNRHQQHRSCVLKNRDLNAAKNIALLGKRQFVENIGRPRAFSRKRRVHQNRNPTVVTVVGS